MFKLKCFLSLRPARERIDNEIAQEIQEQLVRQAEQQRKQEEKDAVRAIHSSHTLTSGQSAAWLHFSHIHSSHMTSLCNT